jgi:uncharacterized membrane protein
MWQWWALIAMGCFAALQLIFAALVRRGLDAAVQLLCVFAMATVLYVVHVRAARTPLPHAPRDFMLLGAAAAVSYLGNLFSVRAVGSAPNPGYAVALVGLQAAVVTLMAVALLGASFSWSKAAGVALCAIGVTLLVR